MTIKNTLEQHEELALKTKNYTLNAGRYSFQKKSERKIYQDILEKLQLKETDTCLDIGCSVGANLLPLSRKVKHITGIDNINVINILKNRLKSNNTLLISGNFLTHDFKKKYDKIILYSVLHVFKNKKQAYLVVNKILTLLKTGGKILIGDLPNVSLKKKILKSKTGKIFINKWNKQNRKTHEDIKAQNILAKNLNYSLVIDDKFIIDLLKYLRKKNLNAYVFPQKKDLPFGHTREDIVIECLK
jgi:2-polyprenyl-3-methyl-5-hydroxy-6-metoxy-1,4-benzoquinol methylase